jgi:hypothetical protein
MTHPVTRRAKPRKPPCRLYVILARAAPVAVIFRRGPSKWIQLIRWNTAADTFEPGQWFRGRIYGRRSDLSPDGSKLIYFAAKHALGTYGSNRISLWTAVSRPPYLTALAFWPDFSLTYYGGGLFESNDSLILNTCFDPAEVARPDYPAPDHIKAVRPPPPHVRATAEPMGMENDLEHRRLARDGWVIRDLRGKRAPSGGVKALSSGTRRPGDYLLKATHTWSMTGERTSYELHDLALGSRTALPRVTWADWDQQGRFVFAREGALYAAYPRESTRLKIDRLARFNDSVPNPVPAPAWAKTW